MSDKHSGLTVVIFASEDEDFLEFLWNDFITVVEALASNLCYSFSLRLFQSLWGRL